MSERDWSQTEHMLRGGKPQEDFYRVLADVCAELRSLRARVSDLETEASTPDHPAISEQEWPTREDYEAELLKHGQHHLEIAELRKHVEALQRERGVGLAAKVIDCIWNALTEASYDDHVFATIERGIKASGMPTGIREIERLAAHAPEPLTKEKVDEVIRVACDGRMKTNVTACLDIGTELHAILDPCCVGGGEGKKGGGR